MLRIHTYRYAARNPSWSNGMRALFIGGVVDNSELDLDAQDPPKHYPENGGSGMPRYRLHQVGRKGKETVYAVYAAPELAEEEVRRVIAEREYARRFNATPAQPRS